MVRLITVSSDAAENVDDDLASVQGIGLLRDLLPFVARSGILVFREENCSVRD
jgi:hypothetical protein